MFRKYIRRQEKENKKTTTKKNGRLKYYQYIYFMYMAQIYQLKGRD